MTLTHTISRWECRECGSTSFEARQGRAHLRPEPGILNECAGRETVDRVYVAVDALLSDAATDAGLRALEALPAEVDGDHLRILNTALQAAVDAVTGSQRDA